MSDSSPLQGLAAALFFAGILLLEIQLAGNWSGDPSYVMNINFDVGVLVAGFAAVIGLLWLTGHEVGAGTGAVILDSILVVILLQSGSPGYFVPPILGICGGVSAILLHRV